MSGCDELVRAIEMEQLNSEEDVRAKVVMKLLAILGYPSEFISTEVPVYYNEGRSKPSPKKADAMCYTKKTAKPDRETALSDEYRDTTLLAVEVKGPDEELDDARTQAEFYTHWTRAPLYCITNGTSFRFFVSVLNAADKQFSAETPSELAKTWPRIYTEFSFERAKAIKTEAISERDRVRPILARYCEQVIQMTKSDSIERTVHRGRTKESVTSADLAKANSSMLISGEPGIGKSELIASLASELARYYLDGESTRIPVILEARGWSRQYSSLEDGAACAIAKTTPEISGEFVAANPDLFCLMVDGLDEARKDRDLLLNELALYARRERSQIICSSRVESDCSIIGIDCVRLDSLSNEQVIGFLKANGIYHAHSVMSRFSDAGRKLMQNPLHLSCLVRFLYVQGDNAVPRNLSAVYDECITSMLDFKIEPDAEMDSSYVRRQLGSYALKKLLDPETLPLRSFLISAMTAEEANQIEAHGKRSGLLVKTHDGTDFSHCVLQEYLAADYLAHQSKSYIKSFCEKHGHEKLLANLFQLLCGCIKSGDKQAVVFDYLECNNLALYMDCLRGRQNLSEQVQDAPSKEEIEAIARQALKSYINISAIYLEAMKPHIPFWRSLSALDTPIRANVSYSPYTTVMHIELLEKRNDGDDAISVELSDDAQGPTMTTADGIVMPILSLRASDRPEVHVYRVKNIYGGIDCAREIAISMVSDDIESFFKSSTTILTEPLGMRVGLIEGALRNRSLSRWSDTGKREILTLRNCNADEFGAIINGKPDYLINIDGVTIPNSVLYCLIKLLEMSGEEYLRFLPPEPDNVDCASRWVWDMYKEETVKKRCAIALLECERSYREYVETFMGGLCPYLPSYVEGPLSLRVALRKGDGDDYGSDWHIRISQFPTDKDEDTKVEFVTGFFPEAFPGGGFAERANEYTKVARMLGRPGTNYHEWQIGSADVLRDCTYIRKTVIKRVKEEVESLFRLR
ncbi:MAG: NACHT domain-containing protein [Coriobacteriaceae bacterium]|nr:NACHT domain-containing protein [Coriobacteriaceae bacterium]